MNGYLFIRQIHYLPFGEYGILHYKRSMCSLDVSEVILSLLLYLITSHKGGLNINRSTTILIMSMKYIRVNTPNTQITRTMLPE